MAPTGSYPTVLTSSSSNLATATSRLNGPSIVRENGHQLEKFLKKMVSKFVTSPSEDPNFTIQLDEKVFEEWAPKHREWMLSELRTVGEIHSRLQTELFKDRPASFGYSENKIRSHPFPERLFLSCKPNIVHEDDYRKDTDNRGEDYRPQTLSFGLAVTKSLPDIQPRFLRKIKVPGDLNVDRNFFADFLYMTVGKTSIEDMGKSWRSRAVKVLMDQLSLQRAQRDSEDTKAAIIKDSAYFGYIVCESTVEIWKMECRLPTTAEWSNMISEIQGSGKSKIVPSASKIFRKKSRDGRVPSQQAAPATGFSIFQPEKSTKIASSNSVLAPNPLHLPTAKVDRARPNGTTSKSVDKPNPAQLQHPAKGPNWSSQIPLFIPTPTSTQEPTNSDLSSSHFRSQFFHFTAYGPVTLSLENSDDLQKFKDYHLAIMRWAQKIHCPRYIVNLHGLLWHQKESSLDFTMGDIETVEYWGEAIGEGKMEKGQGQGKGENEPTHKTKEGPTENGKGRLSTETQGDKIEESKKQRGDEDNRKDETKEDETT